MHLLRRLCVSLVVLAAGVGLVRWSAAQTATAVAPGASHDSDPAADEEGEHTPSPPSSASPPPPHSRTTAIPHIAVPVRDGMLRLPGGRFTMGSVERAAPANERPTRTVDLRPFWIDRHEVTVGDYRACVDKGICAPPVRTSATCTYDLGDPRLPVSCVRWTDADTYCRNAGKRLPSEAEWEFAARGSSTSRYPWGSGGTSCANAVTLISDRSGRSCGAGRPAPVESHPSGASVFGVQDMTGNVEEWTSDWYVEHLGPVPRAGTSHVLRGGGWLSMPSMSRTTSRNWGSAVEAGPNVGFRCAKDD